MEPREGLVSVIVPCYNMERYIRRFLDSVLQQTYARLELLFVNDGSTDATRSIIVEYLPALEAKCESVRIIDQDNAGLAGAVNAGLPHFTGEFLTWPDPDDWLEPHAIGTWVDAMRRHPEVALIRSNANRYDEAKGVMLGPFMPVDDGEELAEELFEDLLFARTFFAPICHFARSSAFLELNPDRRIYFGPRSSQNQQMLLPLVQAYPVLRMGEPLGNYCVRDDSRSRSGKTPELMYQRILQLLDVAEHVVPRLRGNTEAGMEIVRDHYRRNMMLPTAFRGAMGKEALRVIGESRLPRVRKTIAAAMTRVRCNALFGKLDGWTARIASRAMGRLFYRLVMLPRSACKWPGRQLPLSLHPDVAAPSGTVKRPHA